jgi:tetratricopeptide (TPR) repeat protein
MTEEIKISQLDPRQIKQLEAADHAFNKDPNYSFEIYSAILKQSPECLELRKKLRNHQFQKIKSSSNKFGSILGKITNTPFPGLLRSRSNKDPKERIWSAEELIAKNPSSTQAHNMLANAFEDLEMYTSLVFAYETIRKIQPKDIPNLKKLANAYLLSGQSDAAIETGNAILSINPSDGDAEDMMKRASVATAMTQGKWEGSTNFRDQLKDQEETAALEQSAKTVTDSKGLEQLIRLTYEKVQSEPGNLNHYRQLSEYYQRSGDLQNAIAWIQQARLQDAGKGDVSLEEKERLLTLEYYDSIIEQWEKASSADPQNPQNQEGLANAIQSRKKFQKNQLESLVHRYPNEYGYRFELGILLFEEGSFDDCLPHFQIAQRNAKVRMSAILYLGQAYLSKKFYDLAVEQFNLLKSEIQIMDDRKKDAVYLLGCCYEAMGKQEQAIEEFKAVYSADISFRDVAEKINAFYGR